MAKKAALLINLGSPDSPSVRDVRRYLREFLSDPRVLDAPGFVRWMVLNFLILPFRPRRSAAAYSSIWTPDGAPLIITSQQQKKLIQSSVSIPVALAMRYGQPSIPSVVKTLIDQGTEELMILPLYPHYAMSSFETVVVAVQESIARLKPDLRTTLLQPFYQDREYIEALYESAQPYLDGEPWDKLLFSFHGVPERHLRKGDPSHAHCLTVPNCCHTEHPSHATCYRHQCIRTAHLLAQRAGLRPDQFSIAYQSRLGRDPWLQPYTDQTIRQLAKQGVRHLLVICPAFVSDCLETLEEIAGEGGHAFEESGGRKLTLIPCLNEHPAWIRFLSQRINAWSQSN